MSPSSAIALLILSAAGAAARADEARPAALLALTHVTVIDATGAAAQPDMTVVVRGGRIAALGKSGQTPVPDGARAIDATGRFLIPGLWDMHVHTATPDFLTLYLANGVTGVRDMYSLAPEQVFGWRKEVASGKRPGPRIVVAGTIVDGPKPVWPGSVPAGTAAEGRAAVRALKQRGADFIKVYSKLPADAYRGIAAEAKAQGLPFVGHVPEAVSAAEASDLGQRSMEHLFGLWLACAADEDRLRREVVDQMGRANGLELFTLLIRSQVRAADGYRPEKARALFARFVKNHTWQVPTLTVLRAMAFLDDKEFTNDPRSKYMPFFVTAMWQGAQRVLPAVALAERKRNYERALRLVGELHRAGVPLLAGTDTVNPYCFPGFSLHDELGLLVRAGLPPLAALQCATRNPAEYLGTLKDEGTVEPGKRADLVLLEADPLADIAHTKKIAAVVVGGKYLPKEALQEMLAKLGGGARK